MYQEPELDIQSGLVAEAGATKPAELIVLKTRLEEKFSSLSSKKQNFTGVKIGDQELSALKLWVSQSTDMDSVNELSKYLKLFLEPQKHKLMIARISSDEKARCDLNKANKILSHWLKTKLKLAMDTTSLPGHDISQVRLSRLLKSFAASFSTFLD